MTVDLDAVMKGYAAKWVDIEPLAMSNEEILVLLAAARWMESAECRRNGMFPRKSISYVSPSFNGCAIANNTDEKN